MINTIEKIYNPITNQFSSYKITYVNSNIVKSVPLAEDKTDYQAIQTLIAEGNTVIDNGGSE
jgi:hypothetical protein